MKRKRLSKQEKEVIEQTNVFIGLCFDMVETWTWEQLARESGLSISTLYRLQQEGLRPGTHHMTIQKLGTAVGLQLVWKRNKAQMSLAG